MKKLLCSLDIAFSMYSAIPMPRVDWDQENMRYIMCWFPLVGGVIGGLVYGWLWLCGVLGVGAVLTAVIAAALPVLISGGIHLDGFCDTADALASHAPMERKLEILKDPHTGAFALIGCVLYLLVSFGLWTEYVFQPRSAAVLALGFVLSRGCSGFSVVTFRCAKNSGLVALFARAADRKRAAAALVVWIVSTAGGMLWISPSAGICCLLGALAVFAWYRYTAYRQFGGVSGDLAGWFLQLCELGMLAAVIFYGAVFT